MMNPIVKDYTLEGLIDWRPIEKALEEQSQNGYKIAVIETHKVFQILLEEKKFPGKTFEERFKKAKKIFSSPEKTEYAINMYKKILNEQHFEISSEDVKEIIATYYQAMIDIKEEAPRKSLGILTKIRLLAPVKKRNTKKVIIWVVVIIFAFFFIVFLLDRTHIGNTAARIIADIATFVYTKLIIAIGILGAFAALLFASLHHIKKRKRIERETKEEASQDDEKIQ